jgi:hypothetical protein
MGKVPSQAYPKYSQMRAKNAAAKELDKGPLAIAGF